jgi:hypothetical protein
MTLITENLPTYIVLDKDINLKYLGNGSYDRDWATGDFVKVEATGRNYGSGGAGSVWKWITEGIWQSTSTITSVVVGVANATTVSTAYAELSTSGVLTY